VRSWLAEFDVACPRALPEALALLGDGVTPLAGATDLFVLMNAGHLPATKLVSLHGVAELAAPARWEGDTYVMSALTTYTEARHDKRVTEDLPLLPLAAREVGALQIQNRGTWAGNIANASPAADGVPALLAYDATVELSSTRGARTVALAEYFTGYKKSVKAPDELITRISVPAPVRGSRHYWRKVGTRKLQAISKVVAAGCLTLEGGVVTKARLSLGSDAPMPLRARHVEDAIVGKTPADALAGALEMLSQDIAPSDDIRSTKDYRMTVARNLVRAFLS
jgi:CO/xanthine dehydrogenase FAD-binding subunit